MKKTKKAIALVLAGALMSGCFVGCDLVTKDSRKDLAQKIATVDITRSADFAEGGDYAEYKDVIGETVILKRDMIAYYQDIGYTYQNYYGYSYAQTMELICRALVTRQLNVQYAMTYFLASEDYDFSVEGYKAAVGDGSKELAALSYFLNEEEQAKAEYSARRLFNNTLDSLEKEHIKTTEEDTPSSVEQRTLPTGVDTANDDYYDKDYKIYTGNEKPEDCGESYEALENSTVTSRKNAYNDFLAYLRRNNLLETGEKTGEVEKLNYYQYELKSAYESALITKLTEDYEKKAEERLNNNEQVEYQYNKLYASQTAQFADKDKFESSLDGISNNSFLLTAPEANYGYVINILLPFSALQSAQVGNFNMKPDAGDPNGNYFVQRANVLKELKAIDQRASWFTGETDYSYEGEGFTNGDTARKYLFFEDSLKETDPEKEPQYKPLENYFGKYTYNGYVFEKDGKYILDPNRIDIDGFIEEMEGYLGNSTYGGGFTTVTDIDKRQDYYTQTVDDYYTNKTAGEVNYENLVYYAGHIDFAEEFNANRLFKKGSQENMAYSIINELSFAYNTDTAGLNPYLGYSIVTGKTSFVSEFEYASQEACKQGAGTYYIVPSDYGWHIIYCTFSFKESDEGIIKPFVYNAAEKDVEGTFSYYFYESIKAGFVSQYSSTQNKIVSNAYSNCNTIYKDAYKDLVS